MDRRAGALPSRPRYTRDLKGVFVHHTAGTYNYTATEVPAILRGIHAFHVKARGWSDVGYNFLVDRFGRVWEGRAGGIDRAVLGAHTGGFNGRTFGVAAIGDFQRAEPTPELLAGLNAVIAWKFDLPGTVAVHYLDPFDSMILISVGGGVTRFDSGRVVLLLRISGHRDVGQTSCPGDLLYAELPELRAAVAARLTAGNRDLF